MLTGKMEILVIWQAYGFGHMTASKKLQSFTTVRHTIIAYLK